MLKGTSVTVIAPNFDGYDRFGEPIATTPTRTTVDNVLVSPGGTADLEAAREDGVTVALTLHFPKSFTADLRGCEVELAGQFAGTYRVIGEPKPYMYENTPTAWHMPVEVEACHG